MANRSHQSVVSGRPDTPHLAPLIVFVLVACIVSGLLNMSFGPTTVAWVALVACFLACLNAIRYLLAEEYKWATVGLILAGCLALISAGAFLDARPDARAFVMGMFAIMLLFQGLLNSSTEFPRSLFR